MTARTLLLLRHAKSSWSQPLPDFDRPLAARGKRDAPAMADWLVEHGPLPQFALCSPARRCRQTLAALTGLPACKHLQVCFDDDLYHGSCWSMLRQLGPPLVRNPAVMLVGHNPGLDELLSYLAATPPARSASGKLMTTGTLAVLELDRQEPLAAGSAELLTLMRPKELPNGHRN